ncbi:MAG TPA: VWA domain-containing protein [Anaerolineae bacterium]
MKLKNLRSFLLFVALLALAALACDLVESGGPPGNAIVVNVAASTSLTPWLETAVADFNDAGIENDEGRPFFAVLHPIEAGEAVTELAGGAPGDGTSTALWIPDEPVWVNVLANQGNDAFQGDCTSVAESPLVIGMWREVAESLGWPGLPVGWLDVGSLAADPAAWDYYSGGEFGDTFRLGHTHPGLSGTGASTLLAIVQAAESKTDAVNVDDIQKPIVQASVGAFEGGVAWFSNSTHALGAAMSERGVTYLAAAVMYESTVIQHGNGEIVAVDPLEGTFVATFPACINQATDSVTQAGAEAFRDYLLSEEGQQSALANGLRPVNDAVPLGPPLDAAHGVDPSQPEVVFNAPSVEAVYAVQELWQTARKDVNLVMLLDTSGSMRGSKIENMRTAAVQFVEQMGDDDTISIIAFDTEPQLLVNHVRVGEARDEIINAIQSLQAEGDTTLFDAIGDGASVIAGTTSADTTNAMVVLTDGQDTRSYRYRFDEHLIETAAANDTTIFTIAYGSDADRETLQDLALAANGNFFLGDEASIAAIYEEMSAAFGGSVGVGR